MADVERVCKHIWRFRSDIPVLDFGRLGISTYECRICGVLGESHPETGEVSEAQRDE